MMVVSNLDDVFVPLPDDLLVNLSESRSVVESMFQDNVNVESAFGPALKASLMLMEFPRVWLCIYFALTYVHLRGDDLHVYGSDKEHPLRLLGDPFYKQMAAEFTKFQIEVDVYAFSDKGVRRCLLSDNQLLREAMTGGCSIRAIWILNSLDAVVFSRSSPNTFSRYPLSISIMGVQPCTFYLQNGQCKFGFTCKFDHRVQTMRYNLSASSLVDMPVVQYPVGFLLAILAPSSSSLDLRPRRANVAIGADEQRIVPRETRRAQLCLLHVNRVVAAVRATGDYPVRVGGTCMSVMQ
ncbi:hypothetical protein ACFXTN_013579 [Malus domestica]